MPKEKIIRVRLSTEEYEALQRRAAREQITLSAFIRLALARSLREDYLEQSRRVAGL